MTSKEAFNQGFIKKAQEYGVKEYQATKLLKKAAFGENTVNVFKNFAQSPDGIALQKDVNTGIAGRMAGNLDAGAQMERLAANERVEGWAGSQGLQDWIKGRAQDYGIGAAGGGALAAGGGAVGGGLLGKGLGHLAGYLSGGETEQERTEKKRSWGNIGAGVGALGGAVVGGAAAGLGGPLAGLWNTDRGMTSLPNYQ